MAAADDEAPISVPSPVADGEDDPETNGVRCVVHNFPDNEDDDAESTIRALLEPAVIVQHCQTSTTGVYA